MLTGLQQGPFALRALPRFFATTDPSDFSFRAMAWLWFPALRKVPGYDTEAPVALTIAALTTLSTSLDIQNKAVADDEQDLRAARDPRRAGYETLKQHKIAIKDATRSQYGAKRAEYAQAKTVRV